MKAQKLTLALIALLIAGSQFLLTSCGSNKVASSSFIQKRKYTNGYHFDFAHKNTVKQTKKESTHNTKPEIDEVYADASEELFVADNESDKKQEDQESMDDYKRTSQYILSETSNKNTTQNISKQEPETAFVENKKTQTFDEKEESKDEFYESESKQKVNEFAIASVLCGLAGLYWLPFLGITLSIIFGIIALCRKNKNNPSEGDLMDATKKSRSYGTWIVLGIFIALILFILLMLLFSSVSFSLVPPC